ncbi:MAG: T9SS type A sorting domain-containing protein, partial [Prevotella sp.]|nr:T9SS type A sorting domain-containing protein [Prevotella sp.]
PHASFVGNQLVVKTRESAYVSVFNLQGQQLAAFNSQAGTTTKAANWPRGTYIVSVATASKTTRLKIKK